MNEIQLTREAYEDFDEILRRFERVPDRFSEPIVQGLLDLFEEIAANPQRGANHSLATRMLGEEIRTRVLPPYRILYRDNQGSPQVIGVLHSARDLRSLLAERVQ